MSAAPRKPVIIAFVKNDEPISSDSCDDSCDELEDKYAWPFTTEESSIKNGFCFWPPFVRIKFPE